MILEYKLRIDTEKGTFTIVDLKSNIEKSINSLIDNTKGPIAVLKDKSLSFNYNAIELMHLVPKDKIAIVYDNDGNPVIGKEEFLNKKGNILSKYYTIFCSGFNNNKIAEKGKIFSVEEYGENIFRLIAKQEEKCEQESEKIERMPKSIEKSQLDLSDIIPDNEPDNVELELDDILKEIEDINEEDKYVQGFKFVI